jgi:hypothetical protein
MLPLGLGVINQLTRPAALGRPMRNRNSSFIGPEAVVVGATTSLLRFLHIFPHPLSGFYILILSAINVLLFSAIRFLLTLDC